MHERIIFNPITREKIQMVALAAETGGAYTIGDGFILPDGGIKLHYHYIITQKFTAQNGPLFIHLGGKRIIKLKAGESYTVDPGVVHSLFNLTEEIIHYRITVTPGHEGFENMTRILYGLADAKQVDKKGVPQDIKTMALLAQMGDTYFTGTLPILRPWLQWKARQAKQRGLQKELMQKYCAAW